MSLKKIFLVVVGLDILLNSSAQTSKRYTVAKPGTLVEMLTEEEASGITHLVLQGKLNAIDFRHLRDEFKKLQILDTPNASISMYAGKSGMHPDRFYAHSVNCIPSYAFCKQINDSAFVGETSLIQIILSDKIGNVKDGAFKGYTNLKICQIRKKTPPNLLPGALADSVTAVFIPLGNSNTHRNGKRWETLALIEGKSVGVTVRIATTGSLASELICTGMQPKDVNFLTVEGKMDEVDFTLMRNYMPNLMSVDLFQYDAAVIPNHAFTQKKYLLNTKLPHGLKSIGRCAFSGCGCLYDTLVSPSGMTAIEYGAFMGYDNLRHIPVIGNKIIILGDDLLGNNRDKLIYRDQ